MIISVSLFLKAPFNDASLAVIDEVLAKHLEGLKRTRKGREWDFTINGMNCGNVFASPIDDILWDVEDELLNAGLLPEDAPLYLLIQDLMKFPEAYPLFNAIADELCERLGGKKSECLRH